MDMLWDRVTGQIVVENVGELRTNGTHGAIAKDCRRLHSEEGEIKTPRVALFFFLRLPIGQYGPVSQLSRSEESCTGPFNWGEAHCAGEKVKRKDRTIPAEVS